MKTAFLLIAILLVTSNGCKKEEIGIYYFRCKINDQNWVAEKYEAFLSNKRIPSAGAYYDPNAQWMQIWGDRSIVDLSEEDGYMQGSISMNIANFKGVGAYTFMALPTSGYGISVLLQNWASSEVKHPNILYPCSINAHTTDIYTGICTITMFDSINQILEGQFSFNAEHLGCNIVAAITDGKFSLKYKRVDINNQLK